MIGLLLQMLVYIVVQFVEMYENESLKMVTLDIPSRVSPSIAPSLSVFHLYQFETHRAGNSPGRRVRVEIGVCSCGSRRGRGWPRGLHKS